MAIATSENMSLVNQSKQLDIEKILSNWDEYEYLASAPLSIAIMSQLLICSTQVTDFKINSKIDKTKINLIIHPESYCTTSVQIVNESFDAFMLAHTNMEKIQLQMAQVPYYVKECVKLIQSENKNAIKKLLPIRLERIEEAAADGLKYLTKVCEAFDRLGQMIQQVLVIQMNAIYCGHHHFHQDKIMTILGELQKKWYGMTLYFASIKNSLKYKVDCYLKDLVLDFNDVQHDSSFLEFLNESIEKSLESSIKSHHTAATYVKVSNNYIMKPLKQMHGILSIESAKLKETQGELLESCQKAMKGIQDMGIEERNRRIREIENEVQNIHY